MQMNVLYTSIEHLNYFKYLQVLLLRLPRLKYSKKNERMQEKMQGKGL